MTDPDAELQAWHEANAEDAHRQHLERRHRCPSNIPPCPVCQALNDEEDAVEFRE
jgi:hypothetical protein